MYVSGTQWKKFLPLTSVKFGSMDDEVRRKSEDAMCLTVYLNMYFLQTYSLYSVLFVSKLTLSVCIVCCLGA